MTRLRTLLHGAELPRGAAGTTEQWRVTRDGWLDLLDPQGTGELDDGQVRSLIDFLSESGPSRASRRSPTEWSAVVDSVVPELLFLGR